MVSIDWLFLRTEHYQQLTSNSSSRGELPINLSAETKLNHMIRKDATLREVLTTLRITSPQNAEYRHPLARYAFRALYADSANRGHFAQKELGMVYSRDILGEPGSLAAPAIRLLEDIDGEKREPTEREKEERTLGELRFMPGDYLCIAVLLPKNVTLGGELAIKGGAVAGTGVNGWKSGGPGKSGADGGWGTGAAPAAVAPLGGLGRGGGHWRGASDGPVPARGRGGRADPPARIDRNRDLDDRDRDRDRDRRLPPPRRGRDSPPHRGVRGRDRRSRSISRSRTPPPRRRGSRYD